MGADRPVRGVEVHDPLLPIKGYDDLAGPAVTVRIVIERPIMRCVVWVDVRRSDDSAVAAGTLALGVAAVAGIKEEPFGAGPLYGDADEILRRRDRLRGADADAVGVVEEAQVHR